MIRTLAVLLTVCLCLAIIGCGHDDGMVTYAGAVSLDGNPVVEGTIDFRSADGSGPTAGTLITDGKYSVRLTPGAKSVTLQVFRIIGEEPAFPGDPTSPMVPVREVIPLKQNDSPASIDVEGSRSDFDFQLTEKGGQ